MTNTAIDISGAIPAAPRLRAVLIDPLTSAEYAIPITAWVTANTFADRGDSRLLVSSKMVAAVAGPDGSAIAAHTLDGFIRLLGPDEECLPASEVARELARREREQEYALHERLSTHGGAA